ncbi:MAG TPA: glycerophosphodiester phosphodiesterase [Vicinamibacterales bacterium]|nr:glycerophosphodiester phosphodiesterase [Vicinamibacterales bacterium]
MIRDLLSLSRPSAIAHRGGAKLRPENTLAAFEHAVSLGVAACECDVHVSADGEVVVIHDATLDRTTNAHGPVEQMTARELARVDAAHGFGADAGFPFRDRGVGVPRLADLLDRFRGLPWIVEIKGDRPDVAARVVKVVRDLRAFERVLIGSFSQDVLHAVRTLAPRLPTGASSLEARAAVRRAYFRLPIGRPRFDVLQMPLRIKGHEVFGETFVRFARRAGTPVQVWVVDEPGDMRRLLDWGVTGLISARPDLALAAVRTPAAP